MAFSRSSRYLVNQPVNLGSHSSPSAISLPIDLTFILPSWPPRRPSLHSNYGAGNQTMVSVNLTPNLTILSKTLVPPLFFLSAFIPQIPTSVVFFFLSFFLWISGVYIPRYPPYLFIFLGIYLGIYLSS
ncbi:hypothetical protein GGR50DRAFT_669604 [Xylaria sp. CBS 124048]|nr:hypothetical protein GGR50DRAFT_669604 [Xylaria sp. CBS 124048]